MTKTAAIKSLFKLSCELDAGSRYEAADFVLGLTQRIAMDQGPIFDDAILQKNYIMLAQPENGELEGESVEESPYETPVNPISKRPMEGLKTRNESKKFDGGFITLDEIKKFLSQGAGSSIVSAG